MQVSVFENGITRTPLAHIPLIDFFDRNPVVNVAEYLFSDREGRSPLVPPEYRGWLVDNLHQRAARECVDAIQGYYQTHGKDRLIGYAKNLLPSATLSAIFPERRTKDSLYERNGLAVLDIDNVSVEEARKVLIDSGLFVLIMKSVSGTGLFGVARVGEGEYMPYYTALKEEVDDLLRPLGGEVDYLPDVTRLRYFSYDEARYYRPEGPPYEKKVLVQSQRDQWDADWQVSKGETHEYDSERYAGRCLAKGLRNTQYSTKGLNPFLVRTLPYFNQYGISADYTTQYLWAYLNSLSNFDPNTYPLTRVQEDVEHFYQVYRHQHHIWEFPKETIQVPEWQVDEVYSLSANQKLSDIGIKPKSRTIIQSGTGTGKTYWAVHNADKIDILVPTQDLAKQIGNEYGIHVVMQGSNPNEEDQQVGTYNAITKFLGRKTHDRTLFVDEAHTLVTSASNGFRGEVVNQVVDSFRSYKRVILASGTWIEFLHPEMMLFHRIVVHDSRPTKLFRFVHYKNRLNSLVTRVVPGHLNVVFLNDKTRADSYSRFLTERGWKCQLFNADTKGNEHHREVLENQEVSGDIEVLFVTTVYIEGLNLYNRNIATLHILSPTTDEIIEQIANRTRKKQPDMTYIYVNVGREVYAGSFNFLRTQADLIGTAMGMQMLTDPFRDVTYAPARQVLAQKLVHNFQFEGSNLLRVVEGLYEINYLGIAYLALQQKDIHQRYNLGALEEGLTRFQWKREEDQVDYTEPKPQDKQLQSELNIDTKNQKIANFEQVCDDLQGISVDDLRIKYLTREENSKEGEAVDWLYQLAQFVDLEVAERQET